MVEESEKKYQRKSTQASGGGQTCEATYPGYEVMESPPSKILKPAVRLVNQNILAMKMTAQVMEISYFV